MIENFATSYALINDDVIITYCVIILIVFIFLLYFEWTTSTHNYLFAICTTSTVFY